VEHLFRLFRVPGVTAKPGRFGTGDVTPLIWRSAVSCPRKEQSHGQG
jgi:hypothetical protein